jgi:DNA-binding MarR family transcriptional regulator
MPRRDKPARRSATDSDYKALAEFRYHIRRYLRFSDEAARAAGLEPNQYQLLLAVKGLPENVDPTIGVLAERLHLRHHSTVELINRAEAKKLVERRRAGSYVFVHLTKQGERVLARAVERRLEQLQVAGPLLVNALQQLDGDPTVRKRK